MTPTQIPTSMTAQDFALDAVAHPERFNGVRALVRFTNLHCPQLTMHSMACTLEQHGGDVVAVLPDGETYDGAQRVTITGPEFNNGYAHALRSLTLLPAA